MIMVGCPIHNRERFVSRYIASLLQLDFDLKQLRVVFLVNNCTDNTMRHLKYYKKLIGANFNSFEVHEYVGAPEKGLDFANYADIRNQWLNLWTGEEYIFSIDSDVFVEPDTLSKLISHDVDICSALIHNAPPEYMAYNIINRDGNVFVRPTKLENFMEIDITGAVYLIKDEVIRTGVHYGPHPAGEDVYFCDMAKERGFRVFCDTTIRPEHDLGDRYV